MASDKSVALQRLINRCKIKFEPVWSLQGWEDARLPCRRLYEQLLEITSVKFAEYPRDNHVNPIAAAEKKLLVTRLRTNISRCKNEKDNEIGWINNVASLVFNNMDGSEFRCRTCREYRWLPDFIALPPDENAAERLQSDYETRKICTCSAIERAANLREETEYSPEFSNKSDERLTLDCDGLPDNWSGDKLNRPDRVYGLSAADSFFQRISQPETYSPFSGKHTLFPFMIVEAKSGKAGCGVPDIQQQSALSIQTCLRIQTKLKTEMSESFEPLVWFFGYRGDDWHLYMAMPVGEGTQVIQCWQGHISRADHALQLLLIIDWIAFWARDVFAEAIRRHLSQGSTGEMTPARTVFTNRSESIAESITSTSASLAFRPSQPDPLYAQGEAHDHFWADMIETMESYDHIMLDDSSDNDSHDQVEYECPSSAISNAHDVAYKWKHLALPEDETTMSRYLAALSTEGGVRAAARALWDTITDKRNTVKMTSDSIAALSFEPLMDNVVDLTNDDQIATFLASQWHLQESNWQVTCTFWCITCSQSAARTLTSMAGIPDDKVLSIDYWDGLDCSFLTSAILDFHSLSGEAIVKASINAQIYCIGATGSSPGARRLEWLRSNDNIIRPRLEMVEAILNGIGHMQQPGLPPAVTCTSRRGGSPLSLRLFETATFTGSPGVIIKRPLSWSTKGPAWCFISFERDHLQSIGEQIADTLERDMIWLANEKCISPNDRQFIENWASEMRDVEPSFSAWHKG